MESNAADVHPETATIRCRYCRRQVPLAVFLQHNRRDKNGIQRIMARYPDLSPLQAVDRWRRMISSEYGIYP
jgi:hypothetical protein